MAEKFEIKYLYMGQGDCILLVCPNGQLVVIDCGSTKGLGAQSQELIDICVNLRKFTRKNNRKVDILILTHKDQDHYNYVLNVFGKRSYLDHNDIPKTLHLINIDTVYFSSTPAPSAKYALTQFTQNRCGNSIIQHLYKTNEVKQVFINESDQKVLTYSKDDNFLLSGVEDEDIHNYRLELLSGTTTGGKLWSVSIIAGQVPETAKPDTNTKRVDPTNALSLVTLAQIGTSKALFLGDATRATENFLLSRQKTLITNVNFVHVPHHGSRTSSTQAFVNAVNPKGAEVTHEIFETGNRLPKKDVLKRWLDKLENRNTTDDHALDYWKEINRKTYEQIIANWKTKKYPIDQIGYAIFMLRIPKKFKNSYVCVYKTNTQYWGLFRSQTDLNLWGTGADDFNEWSLS